MTEATTEPRVGDAVNLDVLLAVERRVLWLATAIVHHANRVRAVSQVKVGGHQASSASMVSIMTALWFDYLRAPDRVSVKPHASPVLHAINYLLGNLDERYLTALREFGGLQSYPSRTKDPDPVDYSTGSVGIGATATLWGALSHRYVAGHYEVPVGGRQIALVGDAELDEGACWEAVIDPTVAQLGEVLWIVDVNRQSLDRVVPILAVPRLAGLFQAAGWQCLTLKYGRGLNDLFERPGGSELRRRLDQMTNAEFQRLLRSDPEELRARLPGSGRSSRKLAGLIADLDDSELAAAVRDLGGHDLGALLDAYRQADEMPDRPSVIFAYTIKGRHLPTEGHPSNHSALLSQAQFGQLAQQLGESTESPWQRFDPESDPGRACTETASRLARQPVRMSPPPPVPNSLERTHAGSESTQQALGRFLVDLAREAPEVAARVVTVSPDVASSTNLGGWINRAGIWSLGERIDWFQDDTDTLVRWRETDHGQHIELGIAETNLVGLLGELGYTWHSQGQPLLPIGTLYDPFVGRALEPWSFGMYAGGQSILVGTPSGVTLAPEGGAHQSVVTPLIGLGQPQCTAWEPAFGQDFEWTFLHALAQLGQPEGSSSYFRLSTLPVDQTLAKLPTSAAEMDTRRRQVLAGGYVIRDSSGPTSILIVAMGVAVPPALHAAGLLEQEADIHADVICITSADLLFRAFQARHGLAVGNDAILEQILPARRALPIVSVLDGHPATLSFLAGLHGVPMACLGVQDFGQSGDVGALHAHFGIDDETIIGAALDLLT